MDNMDKMVSLTIRNMRFPLIVMIVLLHTFILGETIMGKVYVSDEDYPHFRIFTHIIKGDFGGIAVPMFFLLSGFLFFWNVENMTIKLYAHKLLRRVYSLLIPFLFWNTLFILFVFTLQQFHPEWMPEKKMVATFTLEDWRNAYWNLNQGLIPLWYVRDLMIITLFTPLIYFVIKKTGALLPLLLGTVFLLNWYNFAPGLGTRCSFFFVTGAYWGIKKQNFFAFTDRVLLILLIAYIIAIVVNCHYKYIEWLYRTVLIIGVLLLPAITYRLTKHYGLNLPPILAEASFFVFVFHMFIIYIPEKFWPTIIPVNTFTAYFMQLFIPIFVSLSCVGIYCLCKKAMPKVTRIIIGGR